MPAVRAEGLFKVFGRRSEDAVRRLQAGASVAEVRERGATPAVIDVSFAVEPGEIFVVMGLSGSGKSTLLRMLNGLLEPTAGTVTIGDTTVTDLDAKGMRRLRQEQTSMVFQHFALLPHRTVGENAAYALEVRGIGREERTAKAREALSLVGLEGWADHRPDELSGGMKQRVGLARALAAETDLLLMDEAFSALDPLIRREMQDQLLELQARLGKTIVFITHDLNEAMRLGDQVAVMRDGRIVQTGTPESILQHPADAYIEQFLADVDRGRVFTAGDVMTPTPSVRDTAQPQEALVAMRGEGARAALVVDESGTLTGVVTEAAAASAGPGSVADLVQPPAACVGTGTPLADLLVPAAASDLPLVVVDDAERPLGEVRRNAVLGALGGFDPLDASTDDLDRPAAGPPAPDQPPITGSTAAEVIRG